MEYNGLYQVVFGGAFINFFVYWIDLFVFPLRSKTKNLEAEQTASNLRLVLEQPKEYISPVLKFISSTFLWVSLTLLLLFRYKATHHFPLANFYEALLFLTWCLSFLNFLNLVFLWWEHVFSSVQTLNSQTIMPLKNKQSEALAVPLLHNSNSIHFASPTFYPKKISQTMAWHENKIYGAILAPCKLFILTFAQFSLSSEFVSLVPALKSNWLLMHVSIMIISYTVFILGGLISVILLIQAFFFSDGSPSDNPKTTKGSTDQNYRYLSFSPIKAFSTQVLPSEKYAKRLSTVTRLISLNFFYVCFRLFQFSGGSAFNYLKTIKPLKTPKKFVFVLFSWCLGVISILSQVAILPFYKIILKAKRLRLGFFSASFIDHLTQSMRQKINKIQKKLFTIHLDNLNYRMFGIGFPLFTLGLLSGAVWANSAWGSYWSWDIKEVGSFIHWLFLVFYFHCRYKNYYVFSHVISFLSLLVLFFNFFGISLGLYGSSLHAYS